MSVGDSVRAGRRTIPISHPDRVVFADPCLTKLDLAQYYADVGQAMVPHVRGRPLALHTFPRGIAAAGHFLKNAPGHFPAWIATAEVPKREGGTVRHVLANNAETLVYLAGQNVVTPHVWSSRADLLERPDRLVFDLDPTTTDFAQVRTAAQALGDLLRDLGLEPFAMTTGSRGLHVVVPLRRTAEFSVVRPFAHAVAERLVGLDPDTLTVEFHKDQRGDRIFVDTGRTAYGQHGVAPYAVRPLPGAPVATPIAWAELADPGLSPQGWTVGTVRDRLAAGGDPWREIGRHARSLGDARRALGRG